MGHKTTIYCTFDVEGYHSWDTCPHEDVAFLRNTHRHRFHFKAYQTVNHLNRDIEFIRMGRELKAFVITKYGNNQDGVCLFHNQSCEMLALELLEHFNLVKVEVNEDLENGAIVEAI